MKKMQKIFALLIAMVMVLGMSTSVFAASITINQDNTDGTAGAETYTAYKIFDVTKTAAVTEDVTTDSTLGPGTAKGFAYTIDANSAWVNVLKSTTGQTYFTLTPSADGKLYTVALVDGNNTEAKAKEIAAWLLANVPQTLASVDKKYEMTSGGSTATTNVDDGYYLITSSLGTNLILATSNITINTKNEYIVDQKVAETASVTVGESATYYIEVYLPASIDTSKKVTVHDNLDAVLKFNNDVQVVVSDTDPGSTAADYKNLTYRALTNAYKVNTTGLTDSCDFEIEITTTGLAGKYLVFKYSAELTSAALKDTGYVNEEYSTYSQYKTEPTKPEVKTYDFEFTKIDGDKAKLDGAEFELYAAWDSVNNKPSGNAIKLLELTGNDAGNYKKADTDDTTTTTTIVVNSKTSNKATNISGLGGADNTNGTNYYLVETKEPAGFNKLTAPIIINVKDDGTITVSLDGEKLATVNDAFDVVNQSGTVLPSTGGIGTTVFYILGAVLVIGAGVVLVTRRRMRTN